MVRKEKSNIFEEIEEVEEPEEVETPEPVVIEEPNKKPRKKRAPLSEERKQALRDQLARGRAKSAATRKKNSLAKQVEKETKLKQKELKNLKAMTERENTSKEIEEQIALLKSKLLGKTVESDDDDEEPPAPKKNKKRKEKRQIKPKKIVEVIEEVSETESSSESSEEEEVVIRKVIKKKKKQSLVERSIAKPEPAPEPEPEPTPVNNSFKSYLPQFHQRY